MWRALCKMRALREHMLKVRRAASGFTNAAARRGFNSWLATVSRAALEGSAIDAMGGNMLGRRLRRWADWSREATKVSAAVVGAARAGREALVERLLEKHAHDENSAFAAVLARDREGNTALHWAARKGNAQIVRRLLGAGAAADARNGELSTPLMWAARKGNLEAVSLLLEAGADVGAANKWRKTALENARFNQHDAVAELLQAGDGERRARAARRNEALARLDDAERLRRAERQQPHAEAARAPNGVAPNGAHRSRPAGRGVEGADEPARGGTKSAAAEKRRRDAEARLLGAMKKGGKGELRAAIKEAREAGVDQTLVDSASHALKPPAEPNGRGAAGGHGHGQHSAQPKARKRGIGAARPAGASTEKDMEKSMAKLRKQQRNMRR